MGTALIQLSIVLATATLVINGITVKSSDILDVTQTAANTANYHQISIALEMYYVDHDSYPNAATGQQLIETLSKEGYIKGASQNNISFRYKQLSDGKNYSLTF